METVRPTPVNQLIPYIKADKIKIRICRIWKLTIPGTVQKSTNLHCILVDEAQHAVEASTLDVDYDVVLHETQVLFTSKTAFRKLASVFPPIPRHRFFLQDYNTLYPRLNRVDILTDVIGHISVVQRLEPKQINQRVMYKCDVVIQNIRKEELMVMLWADVAEAFSSLSAEEFSLSVIVVFTSLKVKIYLDIPEVNTYKSVFCDCKEALDILSPSAIQRNEAQILQTAKKATIDELAFLDPDLHKCLPELLETGAQGSNHWAAHLSKTSKPNTNAVVMYKVNLILEDETNEMNALIIGKCGEKLFGMPCKDLKKIFHLRFGNRRNTFYSNDILIHNVTEDTVMQPATPQPLSRDHSSFKRKRESIRQALFTGGEQSGVEEISDTDPRELDEVLIKLLKKNPSSTAGKLDATPPKKS
ncbi:hypothetical protein DVH24_010346 [Malus domestica]|uniref:Replication protein A OB domain-containing protein n=1 Tax=Malus domestica TaxID=3750 RepID=A0A498JXX2_MALDO|nr:hypothetical protein DVH24_010346 [Malus domestica]